MLNAKAVIIYRCFPAKLLQMSISMNSPTVPLFSIATRDKMMASKLIQKQQTSDHWLKYSTDINQEATGKELMSISKTVDFIILYNKVRHPRPSAALQPNLAPRRSRIGRPSCGMSVRMYIPERVCPECAIIITEGFFVSHFLHFSDLMHSYKSITHTNNNFITLAVAAPLCFLTNTKGPGKPPDQFIICHALCQHRDWTKRNVKKKKKIQCGEGRKQSGYNRRVWLWKAAVWFTVCSLWTPE